MADLCLTVIARNEVRSIRRCLESARPYVDRMLVLDTGSSDETPAIALSCGASVHYMTWTGSFSEARNRSMELANASWCLVLDADEWVDAKMKRDALADHMQSSRSAGSILIRSVIDVEGQPGIADSRIPRLIPGNTRYRGRIHEQPMTAGPDVTLDFLVHHDGYSRQLAAAKHSRNLNSLEMAVQEEPDSAYLHFQLAVQYETVSDWVLVLEHLLKSRSLGAEQHPFGHGLTVRLMHALARCGRLEEGLELGLKARQRWSDSSDVHFAFGNLCLDAAVADPQSAASVWLPAAEGAWLECLEIGEAAPYGDHIMGRGGYLAAHNLATLYSGIGDSARSEKFQRLVQLDPLDASGRSCAGLAV
jgi:hypothetical protein